LITRFLLFPFFVTHSNDLDFKNDIKLFIKEFTEKYKNLFELGLLDDSFARMSVKGNNCVLKLDFVNDIPIHFGNFNVSPFFNAIDNPINILSNKISALPRNSAKDIVDILYISLKYDFNWKDIINNAKEKDLWVNPIDVSSIIDTFPFDLLDEINWIIVPNYNELFEQIKIIAKEILLGANNSLKK